MAALEGYVTDTSSALFSLGARIAVQPSAVIDHLARHAGLAQGMAQVIAALPLDAARRQLFVPLQLLQQHGSGMEEVFSGKQTPRARASSVGRGGPKHLGTAFEPHTCAAAGATGVPAAGAGPRRSEAAVTCRRRSLHAAHDVAVADLVDAMARVAVAGVWRVGGLPRMRPSYPAKAGDPVRSGLSVQSLTSLEYWVTRPSAQLRTRRVTTANVNSTAYPYPRSRN
jgi:hypothetical protein